LGEKYDFRDYGIIAEPYFDVAFDEVFYLTDTGRRWDGDRVSVRDKIRSRVSPVKFAALLTNVNFTGQAGVGCQEAEYRR